MCCGSDDDYDNVPSSHDTASFFQEARKPQPQPQPQYQPQQHQRYPHDEVAEKRRRQAQATQAARNYGWPTDRAHGNNTGSRDSVIEPGLAGSFANIPGSDFRAVYDPHSRRPPPQRLMARPQAPPIMRPAVSYVTPPRQQGVPQRRPVPNQRPPPTQRPSPAQQPQIINQQPGRTAPMRADPRAETVRRGTVTRPSVAKRPVIQHVNIIPQAAQVAEICHVESFPAQRRRDSNNVSECSDDDDYQRLRNYTVSPVYTELPSPVFVNGQPMLPRPQKAMAYGRYGAF